LHIRLIRGALVIAQQYGNACHAVAADHADLDRQVAIGDHRGNATVEEIHTLNTPVSRLQLLADREIDVLEVRLEQLCIGGRKARQQLICHWNSRGAR